MLAHVFNGSSLSIAEDHEQEASQPTYCAHLTSIAYCCSHAATMENTDPRCTDMQMIPHCTVMFCMLEFEIRTVQDFHLINTIFRACDEAVECSGMFKYQHVSSGNLHNFVGKSY